MAIQAQRTKLLLVVITVFVVSAAPNRAKARSDEQVGDVEITAPVEPVPTGIDDNKLFMGLLMHNDLQNARLLGYSEQRIYRVTNTNGNVKAEESGQMEYHAPDEKKFVMTSESGSGLVRRMALNPLIGSEIEAASGKQRHDSSITPANYTFEVLGEQQVGPYKCFLVRAVPKRVDKYLFEGEVWIDTQDYAIVRIAGHPAKKLSFWIERADFVRQYQNIDGFWLPQKDETFVQVKMYGQKVLTIDHQSYKITGVSNTEESVQTTEK
jgi:hypothetical protein